MTGDFHDFLFAQRVGLNSPDFIFAFWGSVAWAPLISFYFSGAQPHLGAPQGDVLYIFLPVVPHKAVAEVSKIRNL